MDRTYNLNELAMMSGFTTRTLRSYLTQGLLQGSKTDGVWQFTAENVEKFFTDPYVKEGIRIKRNSVVFDFLADRNKKEKRSCVILDCPVSMQEGGAISDFFCRQMETVSDVLFNYDWNKGHCRVILSGAEEQVARILQAYHAEWDDTIA